MRSAPKGVHNPLLRIDTQNPKHCNPLKHKKGEHWRGAAVNDRVGKTMTGRHDTSEALAMLNAFASVGATAFDVTLLDIDGKEQGYQSSRSLDELRRGISRQLETAAATRHSLVIRPRSPTALLIQLDDFTNEKATRLEPYAFLT